MLKALAIGIDGQDGSKLADWLLTNHYEVHGIVRRGCTENLERIAHLADRIYLHEVDLLNQPSISEVLREVRPDEVYNLEPRRAELKLFVGG
jgi:GDPmannose 4,6-dehydratase